MLQKQFKCNFKQQKCVNINQEFTYSDYSYLYYKYMHVQLLLISIFLVVQSAIFPTWTASPNLFTGKFIIVNNPTTIGINSTVVKSYTAPFNAVPKVVLSICDIITVSNGGSHGIKTSINNINSVNFTIEIFYYNNAQISFLNMQYMAFTNGTLGNIILTHTDGYSTTKISDPPSPTRVLSQQITFNTPYFFYMTPLTSVACIPFLAGFQGSAPEYYQLNLTMYAKSSNKVALTAKVDYYTDINFLYYYAVIINKATLQMKCQYFIDYGTTYAINGIQKTFFSPLNGLFQMGYITGWKSMTLRDNTFFNLTSYSTYDSKFTTDSYAIYTEMSHLNFRVRNCNSPYIYYNKIDGLCYSLCPNGTYLTSSFLLCQTCHWSCLTCNNDTNCTSCKDNWVIDSGTGFCNCNLKFYLNNQQCYPCHYSCEYCTGDQYNQCNSCESSEHRLFNSSQNTCPCIAGFQDAGIASCQQVCGDGVFYIDQCDDGNTNNGDGCSNTCRIQTDFTCKGTPSDCIYTGKITLQYIRAEKEPFENKAKFYIKLTPYIDLMRYLAQSNAFYTTNSNLTETQVSFDNEENLFIFSGIMSQDFENEQMTIFLKAPSSGSFSSISSTNTTFISKSSNGLKLLVYNQEQNNLSKILYIVSLIVGCLILFSTLFFCFTKWKYIGNQTYFTIQIIFMSLCFMDYFNPLLVSITGLKFIMGYNNLIGQKSIPFLKQEVMQYMGYSIPFQYNVNFMLIPQGISLILFFINRAFVLIDSKLQKIDSRMETWYGKIISSFNFELFVFWTLFNANNFIIATVLQIQDTNYPTIFLYVTVCLMTIILALIPLILMPQAMPSYRITPFHETHGSYTFLLTLIGVAVMDTLILMSIIVLKQLIYLMPIYPIAMIIYAIFWRPFKQIVDTIRFALNYFGIILSMCLVYLLYNIEKNTFYVGIGILLLIILIGLLNIFISIALVVSYLMNLSANHTKNAQVNHEQLNELKRRMDQQTKIQATKRPLRINVFQSQQSENGYHMPLPPRIRPKI